MRDGRTRKSVEKQQGRASFSEFSDDYCATLIVLTGDSQGTDYAIDRPNTVLGRGPGVDIALNDETLSRQHATWDPDRLQRHPQTGRPVARRVLRQLRPGTTPRIDSLRRRLRT